MNRENTPYLTSLIERYPWTKINTFPEADLIPSLYTGLYPHEHEISQVRLKSDLDINDKSLYEYLPDMVTTTLQCFIHMVTGSYDLVSIPPWRRRRLEIIKTRYIKQDIDHFQKLNGRDTFLGLVGKDNCTYVFDNELAHLDEILSGLFKTSKRLEMTHIHAVDTLAHWNLDDNEKMTFAYKRFDDFVGSLHSLCIKNGATLLILSDHGQEVIKGSFNIIEKIQEFGIKDNEITYYIEAPKARFWFHTDTAREKLLNYLSGVRNGTLLRYDDLYKYNVRFENDRYGEYYFILNPGYVFFPNDYYHPLGNLYLGVTSRPQRSRLKSPVYRGYHGYLPENESEKGLLILTDDRYRADKKEIETIDFAPTVLNLLGYEQPSYLKGRSAFHN
jgi:hypothetical protein